MQVFEAKLAEISQRQANVQVIFAFSRIFGFLGRFNCRIARLFRFLSDSRIKTCTLVCLLRKCTAGMAARTVNWPISQP